MPIDWPSIGQPTFDRIVEALVHRMYGANSEVRAIDGRGGDGGVDILVLQGERKRIFQLKYFPEGFSSEWRKRRNQIKRSFAEAMKQLPYEWVLVVPCNLTPSEKEFIDKLAGSDPVRISVLGRADLDSKISTFPDLVDYFTRDQLYEAAKVYQQEKAIMAGGAAELTERVEALGRVADGADENWTFDFKREKDGVSRILRAKHPRAQEVSPITINLWSKAREAPGLDKAIDRSFGYGTGEAVTIPAEAVERLTVEGPEWLSESHQNVKVTWKPLPHPASGKSSVTLKFVDNADRNVASHQGKMAHCGSGYKGFSLEAVFYGVVELTFLFSDDPEHRSSLDISLNVEGVDAVDVLRATQLASMLHRGCRLEVYIDEHQLGTVSFDPSKDEHNAERLADISELEMLATDWDVVQRHCGNYFPMPTSLGARERIMLRAARLLVEGRCVVHPEARTLTATLNGSDSPELREMASSMPHAVRVEFKDASVCIAGHELRLGDAVMFHTKVYTVDHEELQKAIEERRHAGMALELRPAGKEYFKIFLAERWPDPNAQLATTSWGLPGLVEPGSGEELEGA